MSDEFLFKIIINNMAIIASGHDLKHYLIRIAT